MNPDKRQNLQIWLILLVVLATTFWIGREISQVVPAVSSDGSNDTGTAAFRSDALVTPQELFRPEEAFDQEPDENRRNPFQYAPEPGAPPTPVEIQPAPALGAGNSFQSEPSAAPPPPPPPIPFRYSGFAVVDSLSGNITALLFDDDRSFIVSEQGVLMGRYRVNEVTEAFVEVEDLEFGRRQRLPLLAQ